MEKGTLILSAAVVFLFLFFPAFSYTGNCSSFQALSMALKKLPERQGCDVNGDNKITARDALMLRIYEEQQEDVRLCSKLLNLNSSAVFPGKVRELLGVLGSISVELNIHGTKNCSKLVFTVSSKGLAVSRPFPGRQQDFTVSIDRKLLAKIVYGEISLKELKSLYLRGRIPITARGFFNRAKLGVFNRVLKTWN